MGELHSLLRRQLMREFDSAEYIPAEWQRFIAAVDEAYREFDDDRSMLERSLELSSQELLGANSDMRALFQAFPDVFFRLDKNGRILDYKAGKMTDLLLPPEELVGKRIQDIPVDSVGKKFDEALCEVRECKKFVSVEYSLRRGGQEYFYEARLLPLLEDQIMAIIRNITTRVMAERQLEHSLSIHRATIESTADGILVVDNEGKIVSYNQQFVDMWGISKDVMAMRNDRKATACVLDKLKDPEGYINKVRELYGQPEAKSYDVLEFKDGRVFERYSLPHMIGGESVGRVWSFRDVTERIESEEALRHSEDQFRQAQKMEAIGRLAGGIAHDFNNILTSILGFGRLAIDGLDKDHPVRSDVTEMILAGERAARLTSQLLAFGRKQMRQVSIFDLNAVVAEMDTLLRRTLGEDVELVTILDPSPLAIQADDSELEQVIINLAVNARDAMPAGGILRLETAAVKLDEQFCSGRIDVTPGDYVMFRLTDNGSGMPPDVKEHAFEPFYTTKEEGKGTGLGLSTVYAIIQQCNGWIELESELGDGTEFSIYFPRNNTEILSRPPNARTELLGGDETILLVEDEPSVRNMASRVLTRLGYHVITASDGREALQIFKQTEEEIHLVLTDVVMPRMSGPELIYALKRIHDHFKVLYVSGFAGNNLVQQTMEKEKTSLLAKPYTLETLTQTVRDVLDSSEMQRANKA